MRSDARWQTPLLIFAIGAVCIEALSLATVSVLKTLPPASFKDVDPAAWVQAVGSVLGIWATGIAVWVSHELEKKRDASTQKVREEKTAAFLASSAERALWVLEVAVRQSDPRSRPIRYLRDVPGWIQVFEGALGGARAVNPHDLHPEKLHWLASIVGTLENVIVLVRRQTDPATSREDETFHNLLAQHESELKQAIDAVSEANQLYHGGTPLK